MNLLNDRPAAPWWPAFELASALAAVATVIFLPLFVILNLF